MISGSCPIAANAFEKLGATSDGLRRFGAMMSQSLQSGTPLSQALRAIAEEFRRMRSSSWKKGPTSWAPS